MFSHESKSSATPMGEMSGTGFLSGSVKSMQSTPEEPKGQFGATFDDFLDRMPGWIFHTTGLVTAIVGLWFALAFLGGLPVGIVEWIALGMFGAFAYALGFMVPLVLAFVIDGANRASMALALVAGGATLGYLALPVGA